MQGMSLEGFDRAAANFKLLSAKTVPSTCTRHYFETLDTQGFSSGARHRFKTLGITDFLNGAWHLLTSLGAVGRNFGAWYSLRRTIKDVAIWPRL
ncbi:hypothetical protein [Pseudalkalibacillus salsuginis]|uniref:hypothetical protein n=1 Tax=Pseudalkalibacillus salsuginis TaxID=2910972 RepID=UPI001F252A07|nr:hypothetical protein [Pseudalkalibacillus salsuginis]MCF6410162.1 hypothetical protein [Pseudalkalibacillus salsuginis]